MNKLAASQILVIDDDPFFLDLVSHALNAYELTLQSTGTMISDAQDFSRFDLIILDINLDEESGCELCKTVRSHDLDIPILFISGMIDYNTRIDAYGVGGNDYITKPFDQQELQLKVESLIRSYKHTVNLKQRLSETSSLVFDVQRDASNLHVINRFIIASNQCKDEEALFAVFFHTLKELQTDGVLVISGVDIRSSCGEVSRLENEIINMSSHLPRIKSFGNNRAFYNWRNCQLLVRKVNELIDILAILMDSLEISIDKMLAEKKLMQQIKDLEDHSVYNKNKITVIVNTMSENINDELLTLGLVSSLTVEEEQHIQNLMLDFNQKLQAQLAEQDHFNQSLHSTILSLRSVSPEFKRFLDNLSSADGVEDDVELF